LSAISDKDLSAFQPRVVEKILADYLAPDTPGFVRLRWFLRQLSQIGHPAAVEYCLRNFNQVTPAVSDVCHYFISVSASGTAMDWVSIKEDLLSLLDNALIKSNKYFQLSLPSLFNSTLAIWERSPCRSGKGGPVLGRNLVKSGGEADITKFPSFLFPFNKALICCHFPW
jgi:hypothetical protein